MMRGLTSRGPEELWDTSNRLVKVRWSKLKSLKQYRRRIGYYEKEKKRKEKDRKGCSWVLTFIPHTVITRPKPTLNLTARPKETNSKRKWTYRPNPNPPQRQCDLITLYNHDGRLCINERAFQFPTLQRLSYLLVL
jgi:hypothetical protein